jgi:hypothetical protein
MSSVSASRSGLAITGLWHQSLLNPDFTAAVFCAFSPERHYAAERIVA